MRSGKKDIGYHIFKMHDMPVAKYRYLYGKNLPIRSEEGLHKQSLRLFGDKNPGYQHGGKFSPFCKNSINYDPSAKIRAAKSKKINNTDNTNASYYVKKFGVDQETAEKMLIDRQTTFSLDKCISKYGEVNGRLRWTKRQEKWQKSFKKQNFSKISQELFTCVFNQLENKSGIYYATLTRPDMEEYQNKEKLLTLKSGKTIRPDFFDSTQNKIIEFDGDYWHSERVANPKRIEGRNMDIMLSGYLLLHVKECDYRSNPQKEINRCLNFMKP